MFAGTVRFLIFKLFVVGNEEFTLVTEILNRVRYELFQASTGVNGVCAVLGFC
jgi:hypothetical protein